MSPACNVAQQHILLMLIMARLLLLACCRDAGHNLLVRLLITCLFMCRRTSVWLHRFGAGAWLTYPLRVLARTLQRPLNKVRWVHGVLFVGLTAGQLGSGLSTLSQSCSLDACSCC